MQSISPLAVLKCCTVDFSFKAEASTEVRADVEFTLLFSVTSCTHYWCMICVI